MLTHASSAVSSVSGAGGGGAETDSFFAGPAGAFAVAPAVRVPAAGRVAVGRVDAAREARGAVRVVVASADGRVVTGRLAAVVVVEEGAMDCLEVGLAGDGLEVVDDVTGVRRTAVLFFSSPDVTDDRSGSASDAVLDDEMVLRAVVPAAGRVGGLFRLDPTVLVRDVAVVGAFDALAVVRAVLVDAAAGRRALAAVPLAAVGRREGTPSFEAGEGALAAILRRTEDVGVEGAGSFLGCGLPTGTLSEEALSRAGGGVAISVPDSGAYADQCTPNRALSGVCSKCRPNGMDLNSRGWYRVAVASQSRLPHALG